MYLPAVLRLGVNQGYTEPVDRIKAVLGLLVDHTRQLLLDKKLINYSPSARQNYRVTHLAIVKAHIGHNPHEAMQLSAFGPFTSQESTHAMVVP